MRDNPPIFVQPFYSSDDREALRRGMKSYKHANTPPFKVRGLGRDIISGDIDLLLSRSTRRIFVSGPSPEQWNMPAIYNGRWIDRFIDNETTNPEIDRLQLIDAFLQLQDEHKILMLQKRADPDIVGSSLASFLGNPDLAVKPYERALLIQKLEGYYEYTNVDNIGGADKTKRYLRLWIPGKSTYMKAIDLGMNTETQQAPQRIFTGFCIPGIDFSPIVMRSLATSDTLSGMLYSPAKLIGIETEGLNALRFDIFTSSKSFFAPFLEDRFENAVSQVRQAQRGPRVARTLIKIKSDKLIIELDRSMSKIKFA